MLKKCDKCWPTIMQFDLDSLMLTWLSGLKLILWWSCITLKSETPFIKEKKERRKEYKKNQRHCFGCKINKKRSRGSFVLLVILWGTDGMIMRIKKLVVNPKWEGRNWFVKRDVSLALHLQLAIAIDWLRSGQVHLSDVVALCIGKNITTSPLTNSIRTRLHVFLFIIFTRVIVGTLKQNIFFLKKAPTFLNGHNLSKNFVVNSYNFY